MTKRYRLALSSLKSKMLIMFVILTSIPLVAVGLISYQKSFHTISENSKASTIFVADQLARNIDILVQDSSRLLELGKNPAVLQFLFRQTDSYADAKEILLTFDLYRTTYKYEDVLNISIVNLYGRGISERKGVFALNQNPLRNPHFQQLMYNPDDILIIPPSESSPLDRLDGFQYPDGGVISIIATVKQRITHEVMGFIVIDLNDKFVKQFSEAYHIGSTGHFMVTGQKGEPIYQPANREQDLASASLASQLASNKDSFVTSGTGKPVFVTYTTSEATGWKIIGVAPLQEIVEEANEIRQLIIVSVFLSILFIIILYVFISSRLIKPLKILKNKMRQAAHGFLEAKVTPSGSDEIADLGVSFNSMIEQIKVLIARSIQEQKQIQIAELRTLQAQINPHFLYNTLDSIVWMAEAGKNDQVIGLVKAMSRFFRISLSKGKDWITVADELEHVRNYLVIQQVRYRDILDYTLDIDPEAYRHHMLKMTMQPIVENALYHGIKNKRGKGLIAIRGKLDDAGQSFAITVQDNGVGMNADTLALLIKHISGSMQELELDETSEGHPTQGGFGLHNVNQRIQLYYGAAYGLYIESQEGVGTSVTIRIPILPGGKSNG
ncbi:two-component system sensor histidine kinase YesM [Paenibacillus endophyticus]|uniref:histidine kinase n=1 Tax=Paenibacillus endophyticus TaxID=1294268 RepID=A0A7W5C3Q7_9BACL|nr:sensor histidine kinase [Paenibacillus endophyticus]MBB3150433.1 two-component system sensor histidine kinase YesM [Paenibacillus endophyticus]